MGLKFALNFKICNAYMTAKAGVTDSGTQWFRGKHVVGRQAYSVQDPALPLHLCSGLT